MKVLRRRNFSAWLAWLFLSATAAVHGDESLDLVKSAGDRVIALLKDPRLQSAENKTERLERLKQVINSLFDYEEIARRTLAAHLRRRTAAEQEEFVKLFRAFLEKIYSDGIHLYEGERVVFGRETFDQEYAEVESKVINGRNEESPVIYRLKRIDGKWKVYDAVVANVSIVNNYRSQFDRVIAKSSYEELKRMLREKAG